MPDAILEIGFKGQRDYLQGGDILDLLRTLTRPDPPISLRMHRMMRDAIKVTAWSKDDPTPAGLFIYQEAGTRRMLSLYDAPRHREAVRTPFDEDAIALGAELSDNAIAMEHRSDASLIERLIVLNKRLHAAVMPNVTGRWILSRVDLVCLPGSVGRVTVRLERSIGRRLTACKRGLMTRTWATCFSHW